MRYQKVYLQKSIHVFILAIGLSREANVLWRATGVLAPRVGISVPAI